LKILRQGFGGVKEKVATRDQAVVVLPQCLPIDRHHHIDIATPPDIALLVHPHLIPGGQSLYIRGKNIFGADRHPHAKDRFGKEVIGTG